MNHTKYERKYLFQGWHKRGVIGDFEKYYEIYKKTTHCDKCKILLDNSIQLRIKCLDHDHSITTKENFRNILCWKCNIEDQNRQSCKIRKDNKSGFKNISFNFQNNSWCFRRKINKKKIVKYYKNKTHAICYKYILLLKIKSKLI